MYYHRPKSTQATAAKPGLMPFMNDLISGVRAILQARDRPDVRSIPDVLIVSDIERQQNRKLVALGGLILQNPPRRTTTAL